MNVLFQYETGPIQWIFYQHYHVDTDGLVLYLQGISSHNAEYVLMPFQLFRVDICDIINMEEHHIHIKIPLCGKYEAKYT